MFYHPCKATVKKTILFIPSYIILCEATIRLLIFSYSVHWQWLCRKCTWFTGSSKWEYRIFSESVNGLFSLQENGYCYIVIHCLIQYCCMHTSLTNDAHGILHLHFRMFLFWSYLCSVFCTKACFKRHATAVLSWLDYSSTAARQSNLIHTMTVKWNGCCQKQNTKIKKRFSKLLNIF